MNARARLRAIVKTVGCARCGGNGTTTHAGYVLRCHACRPMVRK